LEGRVTEAAVYSILRIFKDENRQSKKKKGGSSKQYTEADRKIIENLQAENNEYTYKQIREKWREQTGKITAKLSNSTIERILQEFDYTTKHIRQFIPKYSPHLNAIEYYLGQWAWFINRHPRNTQTQLIQLIQEAALATTVKQCEGWHHEVTRYHIICAAGQPLKYQPPRPLKKKPSK
jgi:transposase